MFFRTMNLLQHLKKKNNDHNNNNQRDKKIAEDYQTTTEVL